jgi:hypothetical protein
VPLHMKATLPSSSHAALSVAREALVLPRAPNRTRVRGTASVHLESHFMKGRACTVRPWVGPWRATVLPFRHVHCRLRALPAGSSFKYQPFAPRSVPSFAASPNPAVEGTANGGARLLASAALAAPSAAPHLHR